MSNVLACQLLAPAPLQVGPSLAQYRTLVRPLIALDEYDPFSLYSLSQPVTTATRGESDRTRQTHLDTARWVEACIFGINVLGSVSAADLRQQLEDVAGWSLARHDATRGPLEAFVRSQLNRVRRKFLLGRSRHLWLEFRDECQREVAQGDADVLVAYWKWWDIRLTRLQRVLPRFWHVPGTAPDEVRGDLMLALIQAVRFGNPQAFTVGAASGVEGTFCFLVREKNRLRRRRQIRLVSMEDVPGVLREESRGAEELLIAEEQRSETCALLAQTPLRLSRTQLRYFEAALEDVREHDYLCEVRLAEQLGVHKSSVSRAMKAICTALRLGGAGELLEPPRVRRRRSVRREWRKKEAVTQSRSVSSVPDPRVPFDLPSGAEPPWLDVGNLVRILGTRESGIVVRAEHYLVGMVYTVQLGDYRVVDVHRDSLAFLRAAACDVPF
jgi:hypothetical protein